MGSIGGLVGLSGGAAGTGFNGPGFANVVSPTTAAQADTAYQGVQNSMQDQNSLLTALQAQNGIQNQNQVYGQLQGVANGTGPNPAQAMLNQATGQNVSNQAALMAGQRGASANPAMIARLAAQQGGALQQQAVGQGASMQAQQSLNALAAAGNMATTQAGQQIGQTNANTSAQQAEQANLLNSINGQNNSNVAMQSNVNNVNGQLANTQMQGQQAMIGGIMNGLGSVMGAEGGMIDDTGFDSKVDGGTAPNISTPTFGTDAGAAALGGGKSGGGGGGGGILKLAALLADGGAVQQPSAGPSSYVGKFLKGSSGVKPTNAPDVGSMQPQTGAAAIQQGASGLTQGFGHMFKSGPPAPNTAQGTGVPGAISAAPGMARGGNVKALVSPGEIWLSPQAVEMVRKGADPMHVGERIGGNAPVKGAKNSYANDIVPKELQSGGIVVPRSETMSKNPDKNSKDFVDKTLAKRKKKA